MQSATTIKALLTQVSGIIHKYDEFAALTGENFNIFRILNLSTREVKLHSSLLAELLNPKGSHGMKDAFLRLFVRKLFLLDKTQNIDSLQTLNATVEVEKRTGAIDSEKKNGGPIDIYIQLPGNKNIIIENKIYAPDQDSQLRRYYNFDKTAALVYLTLDGKEANEYTTKNNDYSAEADKIDPILISYKDYIKEWLEECKKEATNHPLLRETITQYIFLIKSLTHQTMNENMKNELAKLIAENSDLIKSAQEINEVWKDCKFQIIQNLAVEIRGIAERLKLKCEIDEKLGAEDSSFKFYREDWCYGINFYFVSEFENVLVGIDNISNENKCSEDINQNLKEFLSDFRIEFGSKLDYRNWIWVSTFTAWDNTNWANIKKEAPQAIEEATKIILEKLDAFHKL